MKNVKVELQMKAVRFLAIFMIFVSQTIFAQESMLCRGHYWTEDEAQLTKVYALTENRTLEVEDKIAWTDNFDGYGVHIYETDIYFNFMRRYYQKPELE